MGCQCYSDMHGKFPSIMQNIFKTQFPSWILAKPGTWNGTFESLNFLGKSKSTDAIVLLITLGFFAVLQYRKHLINVWDIWQMSETYMIDSDSLSQWVIESMHYCLRPIKGVHFGFANFASHFVRVQIFQIDFPLNLYL